MRQQLSISIKVILCIFIGLWLVMSLRAASSERTPPASQAAPSITPPSARAPWSPVSFEPAPLGAFPSSLPIMHRLTVDMRTVLTDYRSPDHAAVLERLKTLIQQNIVPDVRAMDGLLREHRMIYTMQVRQGAHAAFSTRKGVPYLSVDAEAIAAIDSDAEVVGYMLVLGHEFRHYLQWKAATDPVELGTFEEDAHRSITPRVCQLMWQNEREAYREQCGRLNDAGVQWNLGGAQMNLCERIRSDAAFNQALYYSLSSSATPGVKGICDDVWWDLSGGPRVSP